VNQCLPQLVKDLQNKPIAQIAAGWNHSLVLLENGKLFSCGYGAFGQLGIGDTDIRSQFTEIKAMRNKNVAKIFAGGNHSWAILDSANPRREDNDDDFMSLDQTPLGTTPDKIRSDGNSFPFLI
jgi:alpha-tubulin suppressor-like RCC1 family protein